MNQPSLTYQEYSDARERVVQREYLWSWLAFFCSLVALYYSWRLPSPPSDLHVHQEPMQQSDSSTPLSEFSENSENSN